MGTWITHLRVAEALLAALPGLDENAFTQGSLAPDSGIPNADWTVFDPPKAVTHFLVEGESEGYIRDLEFYRRYLADVPPDGAPRYSFLLGYFFHLLCDGYWVRRFDPAYRAAYVQDIAAMGYTAFVNRIKRDWYGLDQQYVRDHRESLFWRVFLPAPDPPAYLPFLPAEATAHQMAYIRRFYSAPDAEWMLDRPYPYLRAALWDQHVADAVDAMLTVHRHLTAAGTPDVAHTALALLDDAMLTPYAPPLGDS